MRIRKAKEVTASDQIVFTKGQRLHITGPTNFPFSLSVVVVSGTRTNKQRFASKETGLAHIDYPNTRPVLYLEHWRDTMDFSLRIKLPDNFWQSVDVFRVGVI